MRKDTFTSFSGCCFSTLVVVTIGLGVVYNIKKQAVIEKDDSVLLIKRGHHAEIDPIHAQLLVSKSDKEENKFAKIHQKFIKPMSDADRQSWIDKIWTTQKLESHAEREPIEILYWFEHNGKHTKYVDHDISLDGTKTHCGPCHLTVDRSKEATADAILISNGPLQSYELRGQFTGWKDYDHPLPRIEEKNMSQFWVFQNKESAIKGSSQPPLITKEIDGCFNLTNTYRQDSDIIRHFGDAESAVRARFDDSTGELSKDDESYLSDLMNSKFPSGTGANTAWFVSNCNHTASAVRRFDFGQSLIDAGLQLYAEGSCFGHRTVKAFGKKTIGLSGEYPTAKLKFYLSFENAYHCNDYISEKFWRNAIGQKQVPIVFGPHINDVLAVAPPNSFIHAEEFDTPQELVEYISYLDGNDTAYLEYHQWRTLYPSGRHRSVDTLQHMGTGERSLCELCRLIRNKRATNEKQFYKSVMKFWQYDVYPECKADKTFQKYQTTITHNLVKLK